MRELSSRIREDKKGFTLIEVLIVVIILGFLASQVGPELMDRVSEASQTTAENQLDIFKTALNNYRLDTGDYPTSDQGLEALVEEPSSAPDGWDGPYLDENRVPEDPWGNEYQYESPGEHNEDTYDLCSLGRDGEEGGDGEDADINNW
ncbi:MAG: type II secretion system major pseudopilin GspG [Halanaerobiaceae bacterium]